MLHFEENCKYSRGDCYVKNSQASNVPATFLPNWQNWIISSLGHVIKSYPEIKMLDKDNTKEQT